MAKKYTKKFYTKLQPQMPLHVSAQLRIIKLSRFRKNTFYVKLTTFSAAQGTKNETKLIVDLKSKSKINMGHLGQFSKFCLCQQLFAFQTFCMKTRLYNILKTTKATQFIKEASHRPLKTSQKSYPYGAPITEKRPFKKFKILAFLASFISNIKLADIFNFLSVKYFSKGLLFLKI